MKCEICNKEFNSLRPLASLGLHLSRSHSEISHKEYYDKYLKTDQDGICPVCGKETKWKGGLHGYARTCSISCGQKHPDTRNKMNTTNLERYGATNPYGSKQIREKIKQTVRDRYGVDNVYSIPKLNQKAVAHSHSKEANDKRKQTCLNKYGNEYHIASEKIRQKSINTYQERYGVSNAYSIEEIHAKAMQNSLGYKFNGNDSSWETLLENVFKDKHIEYKKQYHKDSRYPYYCDFYLPKSDTFIEINGFWTHGGHWFNPKRKKDIELLELWKSKANDNLYASAIITWTKSDLEKRKCAKKNKINYIVLWNMNDIQNYINTL